MWMEVWRWWMASQDWWRNWSLFGRKRRWSGWNRPVSCDWVICLSDQLDIMWDQVYSPGLAPVFLGWRSTLPSYIFPGIPVVLLLYNFPSPYQHLFSSNLLILFSTDGKSNSIIGAEHLTQLSKGSCCFQLPNGFSFEPLLVFFI